MEKQISVIVTIYNTPETYLRKCIESIVKQTFKEIEIILINDGSTNNVKRICEEYKKKDSRIKLINQENQGESVARNVGIENATTQNITFVDSDDWIEETTCEEIYNYIQEIESNYDIIIFNSIIDYQKKKVKNKFYPKQGLLDKKDIEDIQLQNIEKGISKYYPPESNISVAWSKVYKKEFIQKNNLKYVPNIIRMTDAIFNMEAFEKAEKIYVLQKYLYHYQKNDFAICQKYSKDTIKYYETYIEFVKQYIEKYKKNDKFKSILNIKIVTSIDKYMYNYFFHKDNKKDKKYIRKEFKEILEKPLYKNAISNVEKKYLSTYQKLILMQAKKKRIFMLKILYEMKKIINLFLNKNNSSQKN